MTKTTCPADTTLQQWCLSVSRWETLFSFFACYLYLIKHNYKIQCRLFTVHTTCQAVKWCVKSIIDLLPLKHYNLVSKQVTKLQLLAFLDNIRVFAHQQPANVSKEETPGSIVRVSISLRIFVVNPVVSSPFKDIILWVEVNTDCIHCRHNIALTQ